MKTNFDYLKQEPQFNTFTEAAISAEKIFRIDKSACILNCRRALEFSVKWMYSVDDSLEVPYQDNLNSLIWNDDFKSLVDNNLWRRISLIKNLGNEAAHASKELTEEQAIVCLQNLFYFLDFVACCYSKIGGEIRKFNLSLLKTEPEEELKKELEAEKQKALENKENEIKLAQLIKENESLKEELTKRREEQQSNYVEQPLELSEYKTRKIYIDAMLRDAGWVENKNWINEVELVGMPNSSGVGYADYVLYDDTHKPLAVVEAKKTCKDVSVGRQQAKLYADILEKKYGRRPVVFLTNGFDTRINDGQYPERECAAIYSKRDLEKWFNLLSMRTSLKNITINKNIAGRYYQEAAIKAVCQSFDEKNKRKALLVMATGSGKTRTVIELCDILLDKGWVKNILFLADRNSLVTQAKRNFVNLMPNLSCSNMCEDKRDYNAHCIFSTYQTMINLIDDAKDEDGKVFSSGHFDLVICDEAHRSIYNKYRDIFTYFDAPLVGLTATPKDEIDKNTYGIFDLQNGIPTYGYELAQAVTDGYLVDFISIETDIKFPIEGIIYDELSEEDKAEYEKSFTDEDGNMPETIGSGAINTWVFNKDTIKKVLNTLMTEGLRVDYGNKIGKTIIFAKNHYHAEEILKIFNEQYPELNGYAQVIDNQINYAQSLIDEFSDMNKMPQIAISVDMMDTGIDVPEVLNLVFFKKVMSKAKFWQMIGRGTRLCPGLVDGKDKEKFYIFDFCGNFDFFRMNKGNATPTMINIAGAIWRLKFQMAYKLQDLEYQTDYLIHFRERIVDEMLVEVEKLNRENFAVRQHLRYVEYYSILENYKSINYDAPTIVSSEIAPLIQSTEDEIHAVRFDALMYGIEVAYLIGKKYSRARTELFQKIQAVSLQGTIPEVRAKADFINMLLNTGYINDAGINEFENIREQLRDLIKYIDNKRNIIEIDITDDIMDVQWRDSELENDDLKEYKKRAEYYVRQHQDNIVIAKLKTNKPLTGTDVRNLESILWSELGTKADYQAEYGDKPLGEFVREIVGLDMNAAKEAFSEYLNEASMDSRQIYFVNQIVEYIVHNGLLKDMSVLQDSPFTDRGSIVEIFTDMEQWAGIRKIIDNINNNAIA